MVLVFAIEQVACLECDRVGRQFLGLDHVDEGAVEDSSPVAILVLRVGEDRVPADWLVGQQAAAALPAGEVLHSLEDGHIGDQVASGELIVDPRVVVLAQVGDDLELDAGYWAPKRRCTSPSSTCGPQPGGGECPRGR